MSIHDDPIIHMLQDAIVHELTKGDPPLAVPTHERDKDGYTWLKPRQCCTDAEWEEGLRMLRNGWTVAADRAWRARRN